MTEKKRLMIDIEAVKFLIKEKGIDINKWQSL